VIKVNSISTKKVKPFSLRELGNWFATVKEGRTSSFDVPREILEASVMRENFLLAIQDLSILIHSIARC
jgi:hypothetical protein